MFFGRSWEDWIADYERGHQHPFNRVTHLIGIPLLLVALPLLLAGIWSRGCLLSGVALFLLG